MLTTYQAAYRAPLLATTLLILTLLQGSSFTLTIGFRGPFASSSLTTLVTLGWLGMYAMAFVGLIGSFGANWATWLVRYRFLLICIVASTAFSTAWSFEPSLTLERSVHLIGTTLIALYLGFSLPLHRILKTSGLILGLLMVTSAIVAVALPDLGLKDYLGTPVWAGVLASKNTLGFWSAISVLLLVSLSFWPVSGFQRIIYLILALFSVLCLYKSVSATSLLALITAALVMIYLHAAFRLRLGITAMMVLGILVTSLAGVSFYFIDTAELIGRSGDLTGRGEVWSQTWQLILQKPLTGFGYGTIWYPTEDTLWIQKSLTDFTWTVYHAHNGLLQIASEIGLPLAALTVLMMIQQLIEIVYCQYQRQQPGVLFVLGFTVALLVSNYSEARLLVNRDLYWIFFVALPVSMLQQVTLVASQTGMKATQLKQAEDHGDKLQRIRDRMAYKRILKQRMQQHRLTRLPGSGNLNSDFRNTAKNVFSGTPSPIPPVMQAQQPANEPNLDKENHAEPVNLNKGVSDSIGSNGYSNQSDKEPPLKQLLARWRKKAG